MRGGETKTTCLLGAVVDKTVKKRRRAMQLRWPTVLSRMSNTIVVILMLVAWSEPCLRQQNCLVDGFMPPQPRISVARWSEIAADSSQRGQDEIPSLSEWSSNSAVRVRGKRRESRLQVRRRVKAVLEKARVRTGIRNGSVTSSPSLPPRSAPTVIAEAASIGGLGDGMADIVFTKTSQTSTSTLSPSIKRNGAVNGASNATAADSKELKNGSSRPMNSTSSLYYEEEALGLGKNNTVNGATFETPPITTIPKTNGHSETPTKSVSSTSSSSSSATSTDVVRQRTRKPKEFDVIRGDMPSANAFVEPLPFKLPNLTAEQRSKLVSGERIQEQSRMGREGSGYVVLDVKAPPYVVWECLLDFESYPELIPTVKSMQLYTSTKLNTGFISEKPVVPGTGRETRHYGTPSITRASFILSKFRFNIAAIHRYTPHPQGDYMVFTLDPSCTNMVLKGAKGTWYTEENPDGREVSE